MGSLTPAERTGLVLGSLGSLFGSLAFGVVNAIWLVFTLSDINALLDSNFYFLAAFGITFIPSAVIGMILARQIEKDHQNDLISFSKSVIRGFLIISTIILAIAFSIWYLIRKMSWHVWLEYTISALIIGNLVCAAISTYLTDRISEEKII